MSFPLFDELAARADATPVPLPDWEKYWELVLGLDKTGLETVLALVLKYYHPGIPPADYIKPLPGNKGVLVTINKLPERLQQILLHFFNQV